jgi:hypothetical protein
VTAHITINIAGQGTALTVGPTDTLVITIEGNLPPAELTAIRDRLHDVGLRPDQVLIVAGRDVKAYRVGGGSPVTGPAQRVVDGDWTPDGWLNQVLPPGRQP